MAENAPGSNPPPRTDDALAPPRSPKEPLAIGPVSAILNNFLQAAYHVSPDATSQYEAALADLRQIAADVVVAIARAEGKCPRSDYPLRWALIYAASQLNHNAAFTFLRDVVATPIPMEQSTDPHSFSTVGEETVLRTTAVEGIGRLARQGNKHAFDALFDFLSIPSLSIRRAAVQAILARGQRLRKKVAERLPPEQRYLLNIKPKKVSQVPQIDHPERNLRRRQPLDSSKPTPPVLPEDAPRRSAPSPDTKQGE